MRCSPPVEVVAALEVGRIWSVLVLLFGELVATVEPEEALKVEGEDWTGEVMSTAELLSGLVFGA